MSTRWQRRQAAHAHPQIPYLYSHFSPHLGSHLNCWHCCCCNYQFQVTVERRSDNHRLMDVTFTYATSTDGTGTVSDEAPMLVSKFQVE